MDLFDSRFVRYYSSGIQKKMQMDYNKVQKTIESYSFDEITIDEMAQVLSIIPAAIVLALTILICELICNFFQNGWLLGKIRDFQRKMKARGRNFKIRNKVIHETKIRRLAMK